MNNRNNRISPDNNNNLSIRDDRKHESKQIVISNMEHEQSSEAIVKKVELNDDYIEPEIRIEPEVRIESNAHEQQQEQEQEETNNNNINPTTLYTCRICLEESPSLHANNEHQLQNMLELLSEEFTTHNEEPKYVITTCKCQGTSGYVHQKCIIKWIDTQYKRTKEKQIKCEICLEEILYEKKTIPYFEFTIKNCENLSPCNIVCFTTIILVLVGFVILQTQSEMLGLTDLVQLTIFILIALFIVAFIFSIVLIVKETFYKKRKETTKVFTNDEIEIKGIMKDKLTHYERRSSTHRTQVSGMRSARTIRSARNIEGRNGQRVTGNISQRSQHQNQLRSERVINFDVGEEGQERQQQQSQGEVLVRSLRVIRNSPANRARSVHIRSREQLND